MGLLLYIMQMQMIIYNVTKYFTWLVFGAKAEAVRRISLHVVETGAL